MTTDFRDAAPDITLADTLTRAFAGLDSEADGLRCVTIPIPPVDPLALFTASAEATYDVRSYIEQPTQSFSLVALGSAAQITANGERRFDEASAAWRRLVAGTAVASSDECPLAAPIALGGFSFAAAPGDARDAIGSSNRSPWSGFPEALLTIPRLLFVTSGGRSWLIAATQRSDVESLIEEFAILQIRVHPPHGHDIDPTNNVVLSDGLPHAVADWKRTVTAIRERIQTSELRKLVLAREVTAQAEVGFDPADALRRLRTEYESCTVFAFARGNSASPDGTACFIGATPERLVRLDGRIARVDCLAGTAPRGATAEEDALIGAALLHDDKEREEHELVVDALRATLTPISSALDIADQPRLLSMPNVQHLETPIEATLADGQNVIDLVAQLHPTPAAGGVPQQTACNLINTYEPFDRGWYAGPVGWTDARGDGEFVVAIRSALLRGHEARLYAGCGIVAGSDPDREFEESRMKLEPMRWALSGRAS